MMLANDSEQTDTEPGTVMSSTELTAVTMPDLRSWENSDPFFSAYTRELLKLVFQCYVRQFIIIIGIPGNFVSCIVFFQQGVSDRVTLLLFWLAMADLTHLLASAFPISFCYFSDKFQVSNWNTILNAKVTHVAAWSDLTAGALMAIISVDRCLSVTMPLKARRLLSYSSMVTAILVCYFLPFAFFFTLFLATSVEWKADPSTNRKMAYIADTPWFPVDRKLRALMSFYFILTAKSVLFVTVTVCSTITISYLRKAGRERLQMTGSSRAKSDPGDNKITMMLLFLCVMYAFALSLKMCFSLMHVLVPEFYMYRKYHNSAVVAYQTLVHPSSCANSAVNFFVYLVLSSRFRSKLRELFQRCHRHRTLLPPPANDAKI